MSPSESGRNPRSTHIKKPPPFRSAGGKAAGRSKGGERRWAFFPGVAVTPLRSFPDPRLGMCMPFGQVLRNEFRSIVKQPAGLTKQIDVHH
ncbi:hypothetical protein Enr13x_61480 [Stieleria neptunia]|uniref:Uncharacterized protein n=1 Tax=Stieleria neptunia TaxID=2527979 RepID=A0A518HZG8_9BACT|nr:hypothetical protein Enr13x_61480 [Stieleria neptunia]